MTTRSPDITDAERHALAPLEARIGRLHVRQRLGLERDYEARVFRFGTHFFHLENWYSIHGLIRAGLRLIGLHGRGRRNALAIEVRENVVALANLPPAFEGYTLLHLSDLHLDMNGAFVPALIERVQGLRYDLCVLTGDFRMKTFGPYAAVLEGFARLCRHLTAPAYAVLGNHDTIRMVPGMEALGLRVLLNESVRLTRGDGALTLAGIDDAHYYGLQNFERAAEGLAHDGCAILLSHTPEMYQHAAHAGFALMLSGHTHGGQICLPGGFPLTIDADCPREYARGPWRYHDLCGYTSGGAGCSIVDVRLNCPAEVTLHRLTRAA
jgi:hypothetical protein